MNTNQPFEQYTDEQLLTQFYASGSNEWLGTLLQRYTLQLLGVGMKYLKNEEAAKDMVQQVFLKVIQELSRYKVTYFKAWLYTIARNYCLMQLREKNAKPVTELNEQKENIAGHESDFEELLKQNEILDYINEGIKFLPELQQQCLILFYLEKKSYQTISDTTGLSLMNVKSHIQNGKRNLKIWLTKKLKGIVNN